MSITFTKKQRARMIETLETDFETADEAATAVLATAMELFAERAKFTVVGQVQSEDGDKIAVGYYATQHQAHEDALKLAYSTQTHEQHRVWVLPLHHGTPASYYKTRADKRKADRITDGSYRETELARRVKWCAEHPGEPTPPEWGVVPFHSETIECFMCDGTGRIAKAVA